MLKFSCKMSWYSFKFIDVSVTEGVQTLRQQTSTKPWRSFTMCHSWEEDLRGFASFPLNTVLFMFAPCPCYRQNIFSEVLLTMQVVLGKRDTCLVFLDRSGCLRVVLSWTAFLFSVLLILHTWTQTHSFAVLLGSFSALSGSPQRDLWRIRDYKESSNSPEVSTFVDRISHHGLMNIQGSHVENFL